MCLQAGGAPYNLCIKAHLPKAEDKINNPCVTAIPTALVSY